MVITTKPQSNKSSPYNTKYYMGDSATGCIFQEFHCINILVSLFVIDDPKVRPCPWLIFDLSQEFQGPPIHSINQLKLLTPVATFLTKREKKNLANHCNNSACDYFSNQEFQEFNPHARARDILIASRLETLA